MPADSSGCGPGLVLEVEEAVVEPGRVHLEEGRQLPNAKQSQHQANIKPTSRANTKESQHQANTKAKTSPTRPQLPNTKQANITD